MSDRGYTTQTKIEEYLGSGVIATSLTPYILSAQRYIEDYTQYIFKADTSASARLFDGNGGYSLRIDDCVSVTKVEVGNDMYGDTFTEEDITKIKTLPGNAIAVGLPITEVVTRTNAFTKGIQNNRITAKWGYCDCVPDDIKFVATVLASGMYLNNQGAGAVTSESIGQYSVSYDNKQNWSDFANINNVLNNYKRYAL